MKKLICLFNLFICLLYFITNVKAQDPGLIISEIHANPAGTDSPFEFVELLATKNIDFSVTPYTVIFTNNGTATTQGWINGAAISYAFEINTGTINAGSIAYVGGSSMIPTGTKLRVKNTATTAGDGFGNFSTGVLGNGGTSADAVGVFNLPVSLITNTSIPTDAIFYGTAIGAAVVTAGTAGYVLPVNDLYTGGFLKTTSTVVTDAASGLSLTATAPFDTVNNVFISSRIFANVAISDLTSSLTLVSPISNYIVSLTNVVNTVSENIDTLAIDFTINNTSSALAKFKVNIQSFSTANTTADFNIIGSDTVALAPNTNGTFKVKIKINDDLLVENDEYFSLSFVAIANINLTTKNFACYIKDNDALAPIANNELKLNLLTSFSNGAAGTNSAEIVAHDKLSKRLVIANSIGNKLDIINFTNPANPTMDSSISLVGMGGINSVDFYNGLIAVALEATTPLTTQDSGYVAFFDTTGAMLKKLRVGALPDMIKFTHSGTKVVIACEGEPNATYTNDPEGSICVIDLSNGIINTNQSHVTFVNLAIFNGQETALRNKGIRIYGPSATAAKDLEPEYVTIAENDSLAWVSCQENNAIITLNLITNAIVSIKPLGYKNYNLPNNALDASDNGTQIHLSNYPIKGMYQPDAIKHMVINNKGYLFTANEGDSREYTGFSEQARIATLNLDSTIYTNQAILKNNSFLGRLAATNATGDIDNDGDIDQIHIYGGRSFSIFSDTIGSNVIYDSGADFERITSLSPEYENLFNASNTAGAATIKNRSDDKGPEPEGIEVAKINNNVYAFTSLERIGGVMIYNVTNPVSPYFVGYTNNRTLATNGPDRGAEGMIFIDANNSPTNKPLLILANEISSTLTIYEISTCAQLAGLDSINSTLGKTFCEKQATVLSVPNTLSNAYTWNYNSSLLNDSINSILADTSGKYELIFNSSLYNCYDTLTINLNVKSLPIVSITTSDSTICEGQSTTLIANGASTYTWNTLVNTDSIIVNPTLSTNYSVSGISNGCQNSDTVLITVKSLPIVSITTSDSIICEGQSITLIANGASTYTWNTLVNTDSIIVKPTLNTNYSVLGIDSNGCQSMDSVLVLVNAKPSTPVITSSALSVCSPSIITLVSNVNIGNMWSSGSANDSLIANNSGNFFTIITDTNGCVSDTSNILVITINPQPLAPIITSSATSVCAPNFITLVSNTTYGNTWNNLAGINDSVLVSGTGTYQVTFTDSVTGCSSNPSNAITATINPQPIINATPLNSNVIAAANTNFANPINLSGGISYAISVFTTNNVTSAISNGIYTGPTLLENYTVLASPGNDSIVYTIIGTDVNGCSDTVIEVVNMSVITALSALPVAESISLYPNPTSSSFEVTSTNAFTLKLVDMLGSIVYTSNEKITSRIVNVSQLPSGVYSLLIVTELGTAVKRIVKN